MKLQWQRGLNGSNQRFRRDVSNSGVTEYFLEFKDGRSAEAPRRSRDDQNELEDIDT